MFSSIPSDKILKQVLSQGGDFADLYFERSQKTKIVCVDKKIESVTCGVETGVGLRVIADSKTFYGSTNDVSTSALNKLANNLSGIIETKNSARPPVRRPNGTSPQCVFTIKEDPSKIQTDKKIKTIKKAEKLAWSLHEKIVQVEINYSDKEQSATIVHSSGYRADIPSTHVVFNITVTVSNGKEYQTGYDSFGGHIGFEICEEQKIEETVRTAVRRALLNLGALRASGGTMPVVIASEAGGTLIHEAVGHGLEADLVHQDLSIYKGKIGKKVASSLVTIIDDPTLPLKRGSYLFDDEGVVPKKTVLIEKGILKNYLFDILTAIKMGTESNGHGRRESYKCRPLVRMSNTFMAQGREDPKQIIQSIQNGLLVKMMGGGQVNTVNGDFVFEVTEGYRIENGKIGEPVRGATLTGNGPDILKNIDMVGNDLGFSIGTCGKDGQEVPVSDAMPTIRVPEMVVGGIV